MYVDPLVPGHVRPDEQRELSASSHCQKCLVLLVSHSRRPGLPPLVHIRLRNHSVDWCICLFEGFTSGSKPAVDNKYGIKPTISDGQAVRPKLDSNTRHLDFLLVMVYVGISALHVLGLVSLLSD